MFTPPALTRYLPIARDVWRLALPVIFTNLLLTMVNIVDLFMVGRLGPIEIAAVGMSNTVRLLVMIGSLAVTAGAMALAAQAQGARDPAQLSFVTRQTLSLTVLLALALGVAGYLASEPLLTFLNSGGDPRAVELGTGYLQLLFLGTVFLLANFAISSLMQGAGDTVTPLYLSIGINLSNIAFNYAFIFGLGPIPAMGVTGAAIGTITARMLGALAGLIILYSGKNVVRLLPGSYRPNWPMFRDILSIGIPSGLQGIVRNSAQILVVSIVTSTAAGTYGAAALAIGLQIESLAFMPGLAISVAATSLVGQALGAWQLDEARRRGNAAIALGVVVMSVLAAPLIVFAPTLVRLFDPSAHPVVIEAGTSYLRINALSMPILAIAMVTNGALRGAGDTKPGLIGNLLGRWLTVVPLAALFGLTLGWGVVGVWWALVIGTAVSALYVLWRWRSRKWVEVALHKSKLYRFHLKTLSPQRQQRYLQDVRAPLMALGSVTEHVDEEGVRYRLENGEVAVRFERGSYYLASGQQLLDASLADRSPPTQAPSPATERRTADSD
jgi:putative MATE family efflux protein